jgi:hypothetical protein
MSRANGGFYGGTYGCTFYAILRSWGWGYPYAPTTGDTALKIKFLANASYPQKNPANSLEHKAGDVYEGEASYCRRWIRRQVAVEVADEKPAKKPRPEAMVPAPPAKAESI